MSRTLVTNAVDRTRTCKAFQPKCLANTLLSIRIYGITACKGLEPLISWVRTKRLTIWLTGIKGIGEIRTHETTVLQTAGLNHLPTMPLAGAERFERSSYGFGDR